MPILEFPALFISRSMTPPAELGRPAGVRVRFGRISARRLKLRRPPRRLQFDVDVLTMSGTHRATLASLTLYGASLVGECRLKRREIVALRLPSGRRVNARVRWRFGNRNGIQFLSPVADFAHLLRESRKAQAPREPHPSPRRRPRPPYRQNNLLHQLHRALTKTQRLSRQLLRWCRSL